ncbi:MAG: nicotinate (nicotinamide) nucleotide adenylyltransferase [Candidatus Omnitrophica bacterium]|nr:nicotinate (nicotinamide) nucleotide adenylyltransferase [Candidatus Omnitrophota bacterium]
MRKQRIGLLGGTFNPIHWGHLLLAESAREQCRLDEVWFVPTARPPHKSARGLLESRHRMAMVRLAVRNHSSFRACDIELRLGGVSYTIHTVRRLQAEFPGRGWFLIVGSDLFAVKWMAFDQLRRLCTFVAADRRSGVRLRRISGVRWLSMPRVDLSSSMIRQRIRRGQSIRYLVPDAVAGYLARQRCFRPG